MSTSRFATIAKRNIPHDPSPSRSFTRSFRRNRTGVRVVIGGQVLVTDAEFERLYKLYRPFVVRVARRLNAQQRDLAEDFVQDAAEHLFARLRDGKIDLVDDEHFRALWMREVHFKVGRCIGLLRVQREYLLGRFDSDEFRRVVESREPVSAAEDVVLGWLGGDAVAALRNVRPPGQAILVRKIIDGWSAEQIAAEFGYATPSKAQQAIETARQELRRCYGDVLDQPAPTSRRNTRPDRCSRGHEWTEENTYMPADGYRVCRECRRGARRGRQQHGGDRREYMREYRRKTAAKQKQAQLKYHLDLEDFPVSVRHA